MSWVPTREQIDDALAHAELCQPLESCGLIADGRYYALTNTATEFDAFVMDSRGYAQIAKSMNVEAIVHSHVWLPPTPSDGDRAMCEKLGKPWLIVSWPTGKIDVLEPSGYIAPLEGREWAWGSNDCFGLIRDAFYTETGIWLKDYNRDWLWWKNGEDLIAAQFHEAGFRRMPQGSDPKHCDIFGMQLHSRVVNHLGIFFEPDIILHQLMGQNSTKEVYGGVYLKATVLHLRHQSRE